MFNIDTKTEKRLHKFLLNLINLSDNGGDCISLGYHGDSKFIKMLKSIQPFNNLINERTGFAFEIDKGKKIICYDDSLPINERLEVFAHEAGHCLLGHLSPPTLMKDYKEITAEENAQIEWEADFFAAMFLFVADGALHKLHGWNREHIYAKIRGFDMQVANSV